jgi:phosphotriesterase-related protein
VSIRTVLGDVQGDRLGATDYHEHLFQVTPLLPGDELVDEDISRMEATLLGSAAIDAMIDATPIGLGRNPAGLARISATTGMHIVATTGCHRRAHYTVTTWVPELTVSQLAQRMIDDVVTGMPVRDESRTCEPANHDGAPIRAGVLKVGIDYWSIDDLGRRVIEAIGVAHDHTGAPVMVHLEHGSASFEVLEALNAVGVGSNAVALAHVDRNPDPVLHAELASLGAFLGYDGPARHREHPDSVVLACMQEAIERGAGDRILIGGDVARSTRYVSAGGMPGLAYLPRRFVPRMREVLGTAATERILVDNPRTYLDRFADVERG